MAQVVKYPRRKEIKTEKNNISGYWIAAVYEKDAFFHLPVDNFRSLK